MQDAVKKHQFKVGDKVKMVPGLSSKNTGIHQEWLDAHADRELEVVRLYDGDAKCMSLDTGDTFFFFYSQIVPATKMGERGTPDCPRCSKSIAPEHMSATSYKCWWCETVTVL